MTLKTTNHRALSDSDAEGYEPPGLSSLLGTPVREKELRRLDSDPSGVLGGGLGAEGGGEVSR